MYGIFPLTPAYGRDYRTKKEVEQAWESNKDFVANNGQYCSKSDFDGIVVTIRYSKLTKSITVK